MTAADFPTEGRLISRRRAGRKSGAEVVPWQLRSDRDHAGGAALVISDEQALTAVSIASAPENKSTAHSDPGPHAQLDVAPGSGGGGGEEPRRKNTV
jgi:hypothetical protein